MHRARPRVLHRQQAAAHELGHALLEREGALAPRDRDLLVKVLQRVLADVLACAAGYGLAGLLPVAVSAVGFVAVEAVLAWTIRDGLVLNLLMLVWPVEAVKHWQLGG